MKAFVCNTSALRFWLSAWSDGVDPDATSSVRSLRYAANNAQQIQELCLEQFGFENPVDVLVRDSNLRCSSAVHQTHLWRGAIAPGAFIEIDKDVFVSSPEFTFSQMAQHLDAPSLVKLGYELCAHYRLDSVDVRGFCAVTPRSSIQKLTQFIERSGSAKGVKKARSALRFISEGSASPAETALALLLSLPKKNGGYGFPVPKMNVRVDLDEESAKAAGKRYFLCDLMWPEFNVAIEYDSDMFHIGSEKIADDSERRNLLGYIGVTVITVTRRQLYSVRDMHVVANQLAKAMRKRSLLPIAGNGDMMELRQLLLHGSTSS